VAVSLFYKHLTADQWLSNQNDGLGGKEGKLPDWSSTAPALDWMHKSVRNFQIGGNFSLIDAKRKLSDADLNADRLLDPNASDEGPFFNQSKYTVNAE
jgi:hypothetical protein